MISCQNHKLPVECGRLQNIERNRRVCVLHVCHKQEIGDEYHYSMECQFLNIKKPTINKTEVYTEPECNKVKKFNNFLK